MRMTLTLLAVILCSIGLQAGENSLKAKIQEAMIQMQLEQSRVARGANMILSLAETPAQQAPDEPALPECEPASVPVPPASGGDDGGFYPPGNGGGGGLGDGYGNSNPQACVDKVCNQIGNYNCDRTVEVRKVAQICSGIYDTKCIDTVCNKVGNYNCDSVSEMKVVGNICRGQNPSQCIDKVCQYVGGYNCDSLSELYKIGSSCNYLYETDCIDSVCKRVGNYNCDTIDELKEVIDTCSGGLGGDGGLPPGGGGGGGGGCIPPSDPICKDIPDVCCR